MPTMLNTGTRDIPLQFAKQLSDIVNAEWEQGTFMQKVSTITQDLLRFWFSPAFCDERRINFHEGQKQAILNTIYCHEILKTTSVFDMYQQASESIMDCLRELQRMSYKDFLLFVAKKTENEYLRELKEIWKNKL